MWSAYPTGPRGCWWWSLHPCGLVAFSLKPSDPSNNPRTHWLESFHPLRTPNQTPPKSNDNHFPTSSNAKLLDSKANPWCSPTYKTAIHKWCPIPASQIPSPYLHQLVQKDPLRHPAMSRWIKHMDSTVKRQPLLTVSPYWLLGSWRPLTSPQQTERHHLKRHTSAYEINEMAVYIGWLFRTLSSLPIG